MPSTNGVVTVPGLAVVMSILALPAPVGSGAPVPRPGVGGAPTVVEPRLSLEAPGIEDQDDLCIWVHPTDPSASTIITSDKDAYRLFVYDLDGAVVQSVTVPGKPGNVDLRYDFPLGEERVDIVAYNDRDHRKLIVYAVDAVSRQLYRVDDDAITTGANYGFCLYRSPVTGRTHAYATAKDGTVEHYELGEDGGRVTGSLVRSWDLGGKTEGCVCDDEAALAFFAEEDRGIWRVLAEPAAPSHGVLIAEVGDASGLEADVEGLTLYYGADGSGYLLASNQSRGEFLAYGREAPHGLEKAFSVRGADSTDGIDVINVPLGSGFPSGLFALHNGAGAPHAVEVCGWEDTGLRIDTTWHPRSSTPTPTRSSSWGRLKSAYRRTTAVRDATPSAVSSRTQ